MHFCLRQLHYVLIDAAAVCVCGYFFRVAACMYVYNTCTMSCQLLLALTFNMPSALIHDRKRSQCHSFVWLCMV